MYRGIATFDRNLRISFPRAESDWRAEANVDKEGAAFSQDHTICMDLAGAENIGCMSARADTEASLQVRWRRSGSVTVACATI
jgi:hypothetical protein